VPALRDRLRGASLLLLHDQVAEHGLRVRVVLLVLQAERLTLVSPLLQGLEQRCLLRLLLLEHLGRLGELLDERRELIGVAGALIERDPRQLVTLELLGERLRSREQRREAAGPARREAVDRDRAELALQLGELGSLRVDLRLRDRDVGVELVDAVERRPVLLVELTDPVLQLLELVGDALDVRSLIIDVVREGGRCGDDREEHDCNEERLHHSAPHDPSRLSRHDELVAAPLRNVTSAPISGARGGPLPATLRLSPPVVGDSVRRNERIFPRSLDRARPTPTRSCPAACS
jgi:hypothetical protein